MQVLSCSNFYLLLQSSWTRFLFCIKWCAVQQCACSRCKRWLSWESILSYLAWSSATELHVFLWPLVCAHLKFPHRTESRVYGYDPETNIYELENCFCLPTSELLLIQIWNRCEYVDGISVPCGWHVFVYPKLTALVMSAFSRIIR